MKVLIGTTNPSKRLWFQELLQDEEFEFITLSDLKVDGEPEENGNTPLENAIQKAQYYGKFCDVVICNDSGLYLDSLPLHDPLQPGLHIKRPQGNILSEEEMITYYASLANSFGGSVTCFYLNAFAVFHHGRIEEYMDSPSVVRARSFDLVGTPHPLRHPGWPLDSISKRKKSGLYFVEEDSNQEDPILQEQYLAELKSFLLKALKKPILQQ